MKKYTFLLLLYLGEFVVWMFVLGLIYHLVGVVLEEVKQMSWVTFTAGAFIASACSTASCIYAAKRFWGKDK